MKTPKERNSANFAFNTFAQYCNCFFAAICLFCFACFLSELYFSMISPLTYSLYLVLGSGGSSYDKHQGFNLSFLARKILLILLLTFYGVFLILTNYDIFVIYWMSVCKLYIYIYVWLDVQKHGYRNLSYILTDSYGGACFFVFVFFFIVTFYLFNFHRIFTE